MFTFTMNGAHASGCVCERKGEAKGAEGPACYGPARSNRRGLPALARIATMSNAGMPDAEPLVITDVREGVGWLTLNNPSERNTLTAPMVSSIVAAMDAFEADDGVGAVVVTGAGSAFCAGADLGNLQTASRESLGNIYEGFLRVARSPLPTLAAVNGAAVGAGMNLALGCDVRIASTRARFDTRFLQIGLHPGGGSHLDAAAHGWSPGGDCRRGVRPGPRRRRGGTRRARVPLRA